MECAELQGSYEARATVAKVAEDVAKMGCRKSAENGFAVARVVRV
jgi:hypothetical protein